MHRCFWCRFRLCWITWAYGAVRYEWSRVLAWRKRHDPQTGKRYGTLAAIRHTAENPPSFDSMWDSEMEEPMSSDSEQRGTG